MRRYLTINVVESEEGYHVYFWRDDNYGGRRPKRRMVKVLWVPASSERLSPPALLEALAFQWRLPLSERPHPRP